MANAIFISYRRDDSEGEAGRLFDDLTRAFGNENVFMDVAGIRPGADFRRAIDDNVAHCGVLLSIIGPTWVSIANAEGKRRLEDPNDFVALEIASALKREVPVIPVLVHGAHMPTPDQLPEALKDLSYRNSVELSHARWNSDVQLLVDALGSYVHSNPITEKEPIHANVPVQLPAPHPKHAAPAPIPPAVGNAPPAGKSKLPLILGIAAAAVIAVIAIGYFTGSSQRVSQGQTGPSQPTADLSQTPPTAPPSAPANASSLVGQWVDSSARSGDSLYSLTIAGSGSNLTMHASGSCQQPVCDWGVQPAKFDGVNATAIFTPSSTNGASRTADVSVHLSGANLAVTVHNIFTDSSGSRQNQVQRIFLPGNGPTAQP